MTLNFKINKFSVKLGLSVGKVSHKNKNNCKNHTKMSNFAVFEVPQIPHLKYRGIAVSVLNTAPRGIAVFTQPYSPPTGFSSLRGSSYEIKFNQNAWINWI